MACLNQQLRFMMKVSMSKASFTSGIYVIPVWFTAISLGLSTGLSCTTVNASPPNVVLIFIDDMGYADIGPFGADADLTPNLNRMAARGMRFTDFLVSSAVCSASRSALLTGCYHRRIGVSGAYGPLSNQGIHEDEVTLAELCKQKGYATACYGKWHLGHHPKFLPLQHGFDEYFGLPYSNDMWPFHPRFVNLPPDAPERSRNYPPLPLLEGNRVIDSEVTPDDQTQLTTQYTKKAVSFIERHQHHPFFLYVPHSMVHVPLYVSEKFAGKSGRGLFADVIMEVDWSVGQILEAIDRCGISEQTLVIFTADNGPWLSYGHHAGSAAPLREGKGTMLEGGCRVPTVMQWDSKIDAGKTSDQLAATIDVLPTVAKLIGAQLPDHPIDGVDISPLMFGESDISPRTNYFYYYGGGQLQAVREGSWKLIFPHQYRTMAGRPGGRDGFPNDYRQAKIGLSLFNLRDDIGETTDLSANHPDIVARLQKLGDDARRELGDALTGQKGQSRRPVGQMTASDERLTW